MPEYSARREGTWTISTTMLGWGLLGLALVVVVFFLAGMYVGYNRGLQDGFAQAERSAPPDRVAGGSSAPDRAGGTAGETSPRRKPDTAPRRGGPEAEITITDREIDGAQGVSTGPASGAGSREDESASAREAPPAVTGGSPPDVETSSREPSQAPRVGSESFYTVQIASSQKRPNAERMRDRLRDRGHDATITEASVNGRRFYRVRVGHFPTRDAASRYAEAMVDAGDVDDYWISRVSP